MDKRGCRLRFFGLDAPLRPTAVVVAKDPLVRSGLVHVGNSSMRLLHVMIDARTGVEVASLQQSGVHFDQERRRPTPLPDDLRARALAVLVPTA